MTLADLVPILQLAIGPVILISGVGLLLLSMTNRFGRIIDRSRLLARDLAAAQPADSARIQAQLGILARRARIVRAGIALATVSVLLAALLVIGLFLAALRHLPLAALLVVLFILCLLSLIASLLLFISDLNLSLRALCAGDAGGGGRAVQKLDSTSKHRKNATAAPVRVQFRSFLGRRRLRLPPAEVYFSERRLGHALASSRPLHDGRICNEFEHSSSPYR